MVSGISSSNSYMSYLLQTQMTNDRSGPADLFKALDTDGSGGISQCGAGYLGQEYVQCDRQNHRHHQCRLYLRYQR